MNNEQYRLGRKSKLVHGYHERLLRKVPPRLSESPSLSLSADAPRKVFSNLPTSNLQLYSTLSPIYSYTWGSGIQTPTMRNFGSPLVPPRPHTAVRLLAPLLPTSWQQRRGVLFPNIEWWKEGSIVDALSRQNKVLQDRVSDLNARILQLETSQSSGPDVVDSPVKRLLRHAITVLPSGTGLHSVITTSALGEVPDRAIVQETLQILQEALDDEKTRPAQRREILSLLLQASREFGTLPPGYFIEGAYDDSPELFATSGFSDVYRASLNGHDISLKIPRMFSSVHYGTDAIQTEFLREIVLSRQFQHPSIQPILGVDRLTFAPRLAIVTPWQHLGNVNDAMQTLDKERVPIPHTRWLLQIAEGMEYLHETEAVHGDIRGANVLIDRLLNARLTDFGLTILSDAHTRTLGTHGGLAVRWSPPELLSGVILRPDYACDTYAFGCTCIELYSRRKPFSHIPLDAQVVYHLAQGAVPDRPRPMPDRLWDLVRRCLHQNPAERPSATAIVEEMELMVQDF